jgi:hypothetical protein
VRPRQLRQSEMDRLAKIAALALQAIQPNEA